MEDKRIRSSPLTQEEKDILKEVVGQYYKVLENKKTDVGSTNDKKKAWVQVADAFNSYANTTMRTPTQLKKAWDNLKTLRKKKAAELNQHRMRTGGGPSVPDLPPDPLMDMATPHLLHTVHQEFDSDAILLLSCSSSSNVSSTPAPPLASTVLLTDTPMDKDLDDSEDNPNAYPCQTGGMSFLNTEVDDESTFSSKFLFNFDGDDSHLPQSMCAGDESASTSAGRKVHFSSSDKRASDRGTGYVEDRSLLPSAAGVPSCSKKRDSETGTVCTGHDTEQSVSMSFATVQFSSSDNAEGVTAVTQGNVEQFVTQPVQPSRRPSVKTRELPTPPVCTSENTPTSSTLTNRLLCEEQAVRMAQLNTSAEQRAELHAIQVQEARLKVEQARLKVDQARLLKQEIEERIRARARFDELRALLLEEQLQQSRMEQSHRRSGDKPPPC